MKTITKENISIQSAIVLGQHALSIAAEMDHEICVTIVDSSGILVTSMKSDNANQMTPSSSFKKAFTAVATKNHTLLFADSIKENPITAQLTHANDDTLIYGGGVPIPCKGTIVGAIGIAGAPGGHIDDEIATRAIQILR